MIQKRFVKGKGKFTTQNPLGAPIRQDVKKLRQKQRKKENDDDKYKKNTQKKDDNKKFNPVQYSRKLIIRKWKPTSYRISKPVPGGGTYFRRTY